MATKVRVRSTFAGVSFSSFQWGEGHITVPMPALRKILDSGKIHVHCSYKYTDDYAYDNEVNFRKGETTVEDAKSYLDLGKPWLVYLDATKRLIRFCPMQSTAFNIREAT